MKYSFFVGVIALVVFSIGPTLAFAAEPTITGAANITAKATSTNGLSVTFSVTASDTDGSAITPSCTPPSGSPFAFGTTTVTCTATSITNIASTTTAHFDVGVVDTTPPVISAPANQTFATTTFPANPTVTVSTTTFDVGTTTVTWTATDNSGNSATTTSQVGVFLVVDATVDVP